MPMVAVILKDNFSYMHLFLIAVLSVSMSTSAAGSATQFELNQLPGELQEVTYYYANGNRQQTGLLEDCLKTGDWISYSPEGTITARAYYDKGVKTGKWRIYNAEGNLTYKICYENGIRKWAQAFDPAGELTAFSYTAEK